MSLVGTRPILPDELEQYELHHRAEAHSHSSPEAAWYLLAGSSRRSRNLDYCNGYQYGDQDIPLLHGLKQKDGKFVCRIYGVEDNPKENRLFGMNLEEALEKAGMELLLKFSELL